MGNRAHRECGDRAWLPELVRSLLSACKLCALTKWGPAARPSGGGLGILLCLSFWLPHLSVSLASHSCQHESGPHRGAGRGHVWSRVRLVLRWAQGWFRLSTKDLHPLFGRPGLSEAEGWPFPPLCPPEDPHQFHALTLPALPIPHVGQLSICSAELRAAGWATVPLSHSRQRWQEGGSTMPALCAGVSESLRAPAIGCPACLGI